MPTFLLATLVIGALTWSLGWWGVVVGALAIGATAWTQRGVAWITALGAVSGWALLLIADAVRGRFGALATTISAVIRIPAVALLCVTLLFAALLAWSASVIASEIARAMALRRRA